MQHIAGRLMRLEPSLTSTSSPVSSPEVAEVLVVRIDEHYILSPFCDFIFPGVCLLYYYVLYVEMWDNEIV